MKKKISILGSTGSIGLNTLSIIENKKSFFNIKLLSANKNFKLINIQIKKYKPKYFVINNPIIFQKVKKKIKSKKTILLKSFNEIDKKFKSDITVSAIPGISGLESTILFTKLSKKILIANKESIICGWNLIKATAKKNKTVIVPVDSEHFSILKLLEQSDLNEIKKIYITASGGPFLNYKYRKFKKIRPKDALKHPKWKMGKKISVDSSTMMNEILELIEAHKIFEISNEKIDILIHPNSLVHAIVKFKNGLTKFIYHETSMIIPLANAIFDGNLNIEDFYKEKNPRKNKIIEDLTFKKINKKTFPIIKIKNRLNEYPSTPIIINACNEILVDQFLQKNIPFLSISKIIMNILSDRNYKKYAIRTPKNIDQINEINNWAKNKTKEKL